MLRSLAGVSTGYTDETFAVGPQDIAVLSTTQSSFVVDVTSPEATTLNFTKGARYVVSQGSQTVLLAVVSMSRVQEGRYRTISFRSRQQPIVALKPFSRATFTPDGHEPSTFVSAVLMRLGVSPPVNASPALTSPRPSVF